MGVQLNQPSDVRHAAPSIFVTIPHPPQADWNDSFTFELYFRSNDHLAGFNNLRKMEYRPQPVV